MPFPANARGALPVPIRTVASDRLATSSRACSGVSDRMAAMAAPPCRSTPNGLAATGPAPASTRKTPLATRAMVIRRKRAAIAESPGGTEPIPSSHTLAPAAPFALRPAQTTRSRDTAIAPPKQVATSPPVRRGR